ncbi:unnamed protein product [Mytilus coruscus]|uniref:WSC domain-containing protein n=1 Tax=Mytilus coruscus TaxID=42192 RepID=A0A6J8EJS1_MYTCO|nr:unnamed protein product [Mytilus coruscus]
MDGKREGLDYTYTGCYNRYMIYDVFDDVYKNPRLNMSPFVCMRLCQTRLPRNYFGITGGVVCSCVDEDDENLDRYIFDANRRFKVNDTECDIYCFRDTVNKCGGYSTISIYNIVANTTRSSVLPSNTVTTSVQRTTVDLNTTNIATKYEGIQENGIQIGIIAGVLVGLTFLLMFAILVVLLIRKRSKSNAKRSLQSCSNTNESVRYDNIPQSTQGVNSPYATLTVANDCQTYDDLMPTELTYENTTTMAINYKESTQDKKHKSRRKKRTKR